MPVRPGRQSRSSAVGAGTGVGCAAWLSTFPDAHEELADTNKKAVKATAMRLRYSIFMPDKTSILFLPADNLSQRGEFVKIFRGTKHYLEHRTYIWKKIRFTPRRRLIGECADGLQTTLDRLKPEFERKLCFAYFLKPQTLPLVQELPPFTRQPLRRRELGNTVKQQRHEIVTGGADTGVLVVYDPQGMALSSIRLAA